MIESSAKRASRRTPPAAHEPNRRVGCRRVIQNKSLFIGSCLAAIAVTTAALAPVIAPHDPFVYHPNHLLEGPTREFLLGTDNLGRDTLSRDIYGTRISLAVGFGAVLLGVAGGVPWGLVSGFVRGSTDYVLMRLVETTLVFPSLVLALIIRSFLGPGLSNVIIALGVTIMPPLARVIRGEVLSIREQEFITAAIALGARDVRILLRHVVPNILDLILVLGTLSMGGAILTEASLSFLGFGTPPPAPSWGRMLRDGYSYLLITPWLALTAGAATFLTVLGFYLIGEGARRLFHRE